MEKTVDAIYEDGLLRLLEPLNLADRQRVRVTISDSAVLPFDYPLLVPANEWAYAANYDVDIQEVRRLLSDVRGSLSDAIVDERDR